MTRTILAVLLILSVAGNIFLGFLLLDAGLVLDNEKSVAEQLWARRQLALEIMKRDWIGRSADRVDDLAKDLGGDGVVVRSEGNQRQIGDFVFYVEDGVVEDVRDIDTVVEIGP